MTTSMHAISKIAVVGLAGLAFSAGAALSAGMPSNLSCQKVAKQGWLVCATTTRLPLAGKRPRDPRIFFHPRYAADGDPKTAWAPGQRGRNLGNTIELRFGGVRDLRHISLWNGFSKSPENWVITGRLREVLIQTSDGLTDRARLIERDGEQVIALSRPVKTAWIRIIALSVHAGEIHRTFAISEIRPSDGSRRPGVPLVTATQVDDWLPESDDDKTGKEGESPKGHSSSTAH